MTPNEVGASLIAMGGRGQTGLKALGSVSEHVTHRADCSVLVIRRWLDSGLVGIAATLYGFLVLVLAFVVFRVGGGIGGMIVIVVSFIPMILFAIRGWGRPPERLDIEIPEEGPRHRVLVIANQGLEDEALCDEVCRRTERTATEAMIVAPVVAHSHLAELSDDIDREMEVAEPGRAALTADRADVTASGPISR